MQKTFIKYTFIIVTAAILIIFLINISFTMHTLESQQFHTFRAKIDQVIHTLENNQAELAIINKNLDEDYLTRARAAGYVMDMQQDVSQDVSKMQYLANLLNVDELHVIDEHGVIVSSSVSQYVGIDMDKHPQTRAFLAILESDDENAYLIQDMQPNAAENKIMQYVGVARKGQKGVVQVGFEPTRQIETQSRNTCEYIFSKFPTDIGENFFAVDCNSGEILGHSGDINEDFSAPYYQLNNLSDCEKGAYKQGENNVVMYVTAQKYDNMMICAAIPRNILLQKLWKTVFSSLFYLLLIEAVVLLLLNYLVKRKAVDGIHDIIKCLSNITNGNLDTAVKVGGNPEFEKLSQGINIMVKSIVSISDRISAIIEISGIPLAAFEYEIGSKHVFVTSGLKDLLQLSAKEANKLYRNSFLFEQYIDNITKNPIEGEENIYQIDDARFIRIHMSKSSGKSLGVITDVSAQIQEKKKMQYENTHDALTGLYKFQHFKQLAAQIIKELPSGNLCAAAMLDLDYFKSINDTFGHDAGDNYLKTFAAIMKNMPKEHCLTARRSGDEFCMFIYNCQDKSEILHLLDAFYDALGKASVSLSDAHAQTIGASCGIAWTDNSVDDIAALLSRADQALYEVKRKTKGVYAEYQDES